MQEAQLKAEVRSQTGKSISRKLRREGKLPCVVYGKGTEPQALTISEKEIDKILRTKHGKNTLIRLSTDKDNFTCLIKDYQGNAINRRVTHVDFWIVDENREVEVIVPVVFQGRAEGVKVGGQTEVAHRKVNLMCEASKIPAELVVDITNLGLGQNIHLGDLQLPEGCKAREKYNPVLISIADKSKIKSEEVEAAAAPAAEAPAAPAEAPATS